MKADLFPCGLGAKRGIGMWVLHGHLLPTSLWLSSGTRPLWGVVCLNTSCETCDEMMRRCPASQGSLPQPMNHDNRGNFLQFRWFYKVRFLFLSLILSMTTWTNILSSDISVPSTPCHSLEDPFGPSLIADSQREGANRFRSYLREGENATELRPALV